MSINPEKNIHQEIEKYHYPTKDSELKPDLKTLLTFGAITCVAKTTIEGFARAIGSKLDWKTSTLVGVGGAIVAFTANKLCSYHKNTKRPCVDFNQKKLSLEQEAKLQKCKDLYIHNRGPFKWEIDSVEGERTFEKIASLTKAELEKFWAVFENENRLELDPKFTADFVKDFIKNDEILWNLIGYLNESTSLVVKGKLSDQKAQKIYDDVCVFLQWLLVQNCTIPYWREVSKNFLEIIELLENPKTKSYKTQEFYETILRDFSDRICRRTVSHFYAMACKKYSYLDETFSLKSLTTSCLFFLQGYSTYFRIQSLRENLKKDQIEYSPLFEGTFFHGSSALKSLDVTGGRAFPSFWLKMLGFPSLTGAHDQGSELNSRGLNTRGLSCFFLESAIDTLNYSQKKTDSLDKLTEEFQYNFKWFFNPEEFPTGWSRLQLCSRAFCFHLELLAQIGSKIKVINPVYFEHEIAPKISHLTLLINIDIIKTLEFEQEYIHIDTNGEHIVGSVLRKKIAGKFEQSYHQLTVLQRNSYINNVSKEYFFGSQIYRNIQVVLEILDELAVTKVIHQTTQNHTENFGIPAVWISKSQVPEMAGNRGEGLLEGELNFAEDVQFICVAYDRVEKTRQWLQDRPWGQKIEVMDIWDLAQASSDYKKAWPHFVNFLEKDLSRFSRLKEHVESLSIKEEITSSNQKSTATHIYDFNQLNFLTLDELNALKETHFLVKRDDQDLQNFKFIAAPSRQYLSVFNGEKKISPEAFVYPIQDVSHLCCTPDHFSELFEIINNTTINTPYPGSSGYECEKIKGTIYRPNHNGTHSCRQAYYMQHLLESLENSSVEHSKELFKSFSEEEKNTLILAAYMMRSGRVDESSHKASYPDDYSLRSAILFKAYAMQLPLDHSTVDWAYKLIINSCKPEGVRDPQIDSNPKDKLAHELLEITHNLDLVRCFETTIMIQKFGEIQKILKKWLPKSAVKPYLFSLEKLALEALRKTGSFRKYITLSAIEPTKFDEPLYYACSKSSAKCWQALNEN